MLREGDIAPDFELESHDGGLVKLSMFAGRPIVIFFYPKDGSPGCTRENCLIRDMLPEFERLGAVVLAISRDSPESHKKFASRHGLAHKLLTDPDGKVARMYGVLGLFGVVKRVTFLVDGGGRIRAVIRDWSPSKHVTRAAAELRALVS